MLSMCPLFHIEGPSAKISDLLAEIEAKIGADKNKARSLDIRHKQEGQETKAAGVFDSKYWTKFR